MTAPDTLPIPPTDRIATTLERLADTLDRIEKHLAPEIISSDTATPDPLERIAEALDSLAALHAAGPAVFGTPDTVAPSNPQAALYAQADGWIEWAGGVCPVDPHTKVDWKGRNGICATDTARDLNWTHENNGDQIDIVAYRIRKDAQ